MLVLTRRIAETIIIELPEGQVVIQPVETSYGKAKIGIDAPSGCYVGREPPLTAEDLAQRTEEEISSLVNKLAGLAGISQQELVEFVAAARQRKAPPVDMPIEEVVGSTEMVKKVGGKRKRQSKGKTDG